MLICTLGFVLPQICSENTGLIRNNLNKEIIMNAASVGISKDVTVPRLKILSWGLPAETEGNRAKSQLRY